MENPLLIGGISFLALLALVFAGVHIAFAGVVVGFTVVASVFGLSPALGVVKETPYTIASMYELSVIPLFVFMGNVVLYAGFARDLFRTAQLWLSRFPGALALAATAAVGVWSAASASSLATAALFGRIAPPEMEALGYDRKLSYGCVAASSGLDQLIPPAILMVVYSILAQIPLGKLFIAGIIPGIIIVLLFMAMISIRTWLNPRLAPSAPAVSWRMRFASLGGGVWGIFALVIIVLGGIYVGIFTPTEAGGVGAVGAVALSLGSRRLKLAGLLQALKGTVGTTAMIFAIVVGVNLFTRLIVLTGFSREFIATMSGLPVPRIVILITIFGLFFLMGMFMDALGMLILLVPITLPVVTALGYNGLHFGILAMVLSGVALITPPVGVACYIVKGVAPPEVSLDDIFRGIGWFLAMYIVALALLTAFPQLSLFLPNLML
jgi:tripartite ATP-independent transporter DctM subunit